jgi:hypothetical protein
VGVWLDDIPVLVAFDTSKGVVTATFKWLEDYMFLSEKRASEEAKGGQIGRVK